MVKAELKIIRAYFAFFIVCAFFSACSSESALPNWLLGPWQARYEGIDIKETWYSKNDRLVGKTIWTLDHHQRFEKLTIFQNKDKKLVYRVEMEGKSLDFICKESGKDSLIFVNETNDFPKRLVYVKPVSNSMKVYIDNSPTDPNRMSFHFRRCK